MKTIILRKLNFVLLTILLTQGVFAQTSNHPWSVGLGVGILDYKGELGNGLFNFQLKSFEINSVKSNNRPGIGVLTVARYLNEKFDVAVNGHWGEWGYYNTDNNSFFYRNSRYLDANIRWKFLSKTPKYFEPFALAGLGYRNLEATQVTSAQNELVLPLGLGARIPFNDRLGLTLQSNLGLTTGDNGDANIEGGKDIFWNHSLVLSYSFGKVDGDADKDGVKDSKDKCPNTPEGAKVDEDGCEIDTDKDGISDRLDSCPAVPGIPAFNGCPDRDNDGVQDKQDECPDNAGEIGLKGCPDKDKDGIADKDDACPEVFGVALFKGCPDTDNDSIQDAKDDCPTIKGLAIFNGCPDRDEDGVPDKDDACPDVKGLKELKGCPKDNPNPVPPIPPVPVPPAPKPDTIEVQSIRFKLNSTELTEESVERLAKAIDYMKTNKGYTLLLSGHTDNTGSAAYNLELSKRRASSVKTYLIGKGVPATSIRTQGFGLKFPISDNETEEGRFENRRVILQGIKK